MNESVSALNYKKFLRYYKWDTEVSVQVVNLARKEADKTVVRIMTREMVLYALVLYVGIPKVMSLVYQNQGHNKQLYLQDISGPGPLTRTRSGDSGFD